MTLPAYEKMGAFYLGKDYDVDQGKVTDELLLYDAKDLTTHAVCVGMTGSGKTGLCLSLLEEAAIDGVPAIAIDPKGDLGNLMLTFPSLEASDFEPWIEEGAATRKGRTVPEHAKKTAELWKRTFWCASVVKCMLICETAASKKTQRNTMDSIFFFNANA